MESGYANRADCQVPGILHRAHGPQLNSLGGCADSSYLTYSVKKQPLFLFYVYSMKRSTGGGIKMNTEHYSELICDPSRGWGYLMGMKPLRKFPQDPKRAPWFFPSSIPNLNLFLLLDLSRICRSREVPEPAGPPVPQHLIPSVSLTIHITPRFRGIC